MNKFRRIQAAAIAAVALSGLSVESSAGWEQAVGAVAGAALGNQVGGGNGKVIATVVGGVAGNEVGKHVGESRANSNGIPGYASQKKPDTTIRESVGAIGGGLLGAGLGNQVGGGNGKIIATVVGGIAGSLIGRELAKPDEIVMRDVQGREWRNGTQPMDPLTELPNFRRELTSAQLAYGEYLASTERASAAKNDFDWHRISQGDYQKTKYAAHQSANNFERARSRMNDIASTVASTYDKKIELDDLLIIASCNAVPVGGPDRVNYQEVVHEGRRCMSSSKLSMK